MFKLDNPIQNYAWGSHHALAKLLGAPSPSEKPEAELWLGAHPSAPSRVLPSGESLAAFIERDPERVLGTDAHRKYGARLPFLLKVLAAESPLSLQAHPNSAQARAGFETEEARGVPITASSRNYKDPNHKPELICALTPFSALCGFRGIPQTLELFRFLGGSLLKYVVEILAELPNEAGLAQVFSTLMSASPERKASLAREVLDRATLLAAIEGPFQHELSSAVRIGVLYPGDVGIVTALLLNLVRLEPGQALYLAAGNLHAYLEGVGVEIMANSDNVLRGGLTPKHVDIGELSHVLDFRSGPVEVLRGEEVGGARVYRTPAPEFELSSVRLPADHAVNLSDRRGPEIVLCEQGEVTLSDSRETLSLAQGQAAFIAADEPGYAVSGTGRLFRACLGRG